MPEPSGHRGATVLGRPRTAATAVQAVVAAPAVVAAATAGADRSRISPRSNGPLTRAVRIVALADPAAAGAMPLHPRVAALAIGRP